MKSLRIATRNSRLALWQAHHVADCLREHGFDTELVPLVSGGDTDLRPIDGTRQVGVFTKRIQQALLDDEADIAVHSLKDLPTEVDPRLRLASVPEREVVDDALVSPAGWSLEQLPTGARVGTGSRRRGAQLLSVRPDLHILAIRGNVQTRLQKLEQGEFDALVLAEAGLRRLELHELSRTTLPMTLMLPAPGQGALGIEVRSDDDATANAVVQLDHIPTHAAVLAERHLLARLHGGCLAPIAALGECSPNVLQLKAVVLSGNGATRIDKDSSCRFDAQAWREIARSLAERVADQLLDEGAAELIESQR
jgi:hydroxymethylbilane synthase